MNLKKKDERSHTQKIVYNSICITFQEGKAQVDTGTNTFKIATELLTKFRMMAYSGGQQGKVFKEVSTGPFLYTDNILFLIGWVVNT